MSDQGNQSMEYETLVLELGHYAAWHVAMADAGIEFHRMERA